MLKYPIGIQDFEKLRLGNFVYVDKTEFVEKLLNGGSNYFLSRPRRFGKSLFISTLKYFFLGRKDLFAGLHIESKVNQEAKPVLHLDFSNEAWKELGLRVHIQNILQEHAKNFQLTLTNESLSDRFSELITSLPQKPVILIDEYDKPILHFLGKDNNRANENREIMREFYSVLKPLEGDIHFLFVTGITRFSKTSLFSDMNHLMDLTINPHYATICGYTEEELYFYFAQDIAYYAAEKQVDLLDFKQKIKEWYNGYRWHISKPSVYNPFSILNFLGGSGDFQNYWFNSGLPTFLINTINRNEDYDFEEVRASGTMLNNFSIERLNSITLMFQAGYLTLKDRDEDDYILVYPNQEVKRSLLAVILSDKMDEDDSGVLVRQLRKYFENRQEKEIRKTFDALFAKIPYQIFQEKSEFYYHSILVVAMQLLGCYIDAEVSVNDGRVDAVVKTKNYIYIIEFKVDQSAGIALDQIKEKAYERAFQAENKTILLLGVNFMAKKVESFLLEEHQSKFY